MSATSRSAGVKHRIAVVIPYYVQIGGERFSSELTMRLARRDDFDIHLFANRWVSNSDRITYHKVPIIRFPRFLRPLSFAFFANRMIDKIGFDLIHTHAPIFRADIFSVHWVPHAGWIREVRKKRASLFDMAKIGVERRMMVNAEKSWFLPVSSITEEAHHREYKYVPGTWKLFHPGVDLNCFSDPDRNDCRRLIRGRYGIGEGDILILFVGKNYQIKGLATVMAALSRVRAARPEAAIRLLVVGHGDEHRYREIARSLGIGGVVEFAGMQTEGIERYFRAADLFAIPSLFDTFGMVVLEAMAAGLPVIVSPNVGAKDLVIDGVNGFVIPEVDDADSVADRIIRLLDPKLRREMGAAAMRTAAEHDWERLAADMEQVYRTILSRNMGEREEGQHAGR